MQKDAIMTMVEKELKAHPEIPSSELQAKVAKKHASVRKLSTRQFHARYPLRVKKRWSLEKGGSKAKRRVIRRKAAAARPARKPAVKACRDQTREILVRFADELLQMRDPSFTTVLSRVDHYASLVEGK